MICSRSFVRLAVLAVLSIPSPAGAQWVTNGAAVCESAIDQTQPASVSDGAGGTIVAWQHGSIVAVTTDIYAQRLNAAGVPQWTHGGVPVCNASDLQQNPVIVSDGAGGAILAWEDTRSGQAGLYAQRLNSAGTPLWTANGLKLNTGNFLVTPGTLTLAADGAGGAVIGCCYTGGPIGVIAQRINSAGAVQWGFGGVSVASSSSSRIRIVSDLAGGAVLAWHDTRAGNIDIYARHVNAAGTPMGPVDGTGLCTLSSDQTFLEIASDDSAGAIVTWQDNRGSTMGVYANRYVGGSLTRWAANGVTVCDTIGAQSEPHIVGDGAGGAIIAWNDSRRGGTRPDLYAQRLNSSGVRQWGTTGMVVKLAPAAQTPSVVDPLVVVPDDAGGAIVAWVDTRSDSGDIYAQRISSSGAQQWPGGGVPLCTAVRTQAGARIVSDGASGAIVVWQDQRNGFDVYAQRVSAAGVPSTPNAGWASGCNAICTVDSAQTIPLTVPDGAGGAFIVWADRRDNGLIHIYGQRVDANGAHQWTDQGILIRGGSYANPTSAAPDGEGGLIVAWYDGAPDIYAQHVTAAGTLLWPSQGVAVCTATGMQADPRIATDASGGAIITWQDARLGALNAEVYAQHVSRTGAPVWAPNGIPLSTAPGGQTQPEIAATGDGGAIVTWIDFGGASPDIYAQKVNAAGSTAWTTNGVAVCTAARGQVAPSIVSDGAKGAIVVWQDDRGVNNDVYAQRVDSAGVASWTPNGVAIAAVANDQLDPQIASDGTGGAIISWYDSRGATYDIYAQRVSRTGVPQWTVNGVKACGATGHQGSSRVCSDGSGGAIVAWTDPRSGTHAIYAQRLNSAGSALWTADGVGLCPGAETQSGPTLAPDGLGGVIAAWTDFRDAPNHVGDIYAQHVGADGALGSSPPIAWDPNGAPVCDVPGFQLNPAMAPDAQGGAIFAWEDYRDTTLATQRGGGGNVVLGPGGARVRTVKFDESGNTASGWTSGGQQITATGSNQLEPAAVNDGQGGAVVVWKDDRNGGFDLYASRVTATGTTAAGWPAAGLAICTATGDQSRPRVTIDQLGGAIVTWTDARNGATDIFAQRVNASGVVQWTANGIALCTASNAQQDPAIVSDGAGGAIVAWTDARGAAADVYAQRVSGAGSTQWAANGIALCAATAAQQRPSMAPDAGGGAIVAWEDARSGNFDVYGQRVLGVGTVQWTVDGVALCNLAGDQKAPSVVVDGTGGAILSWFDRRGGNDDIYAQRVVDTGVPQWTANGVALCTAAGDQQVPATVYDNLGGAIVTWQDGRAGATDIYATRILGSGTLDPRYAIDGTAICTASGTQSAPLIVPDGTGGAIVGWTDARSADTDIYAYHLLPPVSQSVTDVPAAPGIAALRLGSSYPNPTRVRATVRLEIATAQRVSTDVLDVTGRRVRTLFIARWLPPGVHRIDWDGRDDAGAAVEAGIYFLRVRDGERMQSRRIAMIR